MILAADIGGTKIATALVDEGGELASEVRQTPTPAAEGATSILEATIGLLQVLDGLEVDLVAVFSAGVIDVGTGSVVAATSSPSGWAGTPIAGHLRQRLQRPVYVIGDGHAFALATSLYGAGQGADSLLLLAAGTGIGGSYLHRGEPVLGAHHVGGHVGHLAVPQADGLQCPCGRTGHLEAIAGGTGILNWYHGNGGDRAVLTIRALAARRDDPMAREALRLGATALGTAAAGLANALDPDLVVVTGGLTQAGPWWQQSLREAYAAQLMPALADLSLVITDTGAAMALRGAAAHAVRRHQHDECALAEFRLTGRVSA